MVLPLISSDHVLNSKPGSDSAVDTIRNKIWRLLGQFSSSLSSDVLKSLDRPSQNHFVIRIIRLIVLMAANCTHYRLDCIKIVSGIVERFTRLMGVRSLFGFLAPVFFFPNNFKATGKTNWNSADNFGMIVKKALDTLMKKIHLYDPLILIYAGQDITFSSFYIKDIRNKVCVSVLLEDKTYAFDSSALDPGAVKTIQSEVIGSSQPEGDSSAVSEGAVEEVEIGGLVEADVSLPIAAWIRDLLIRLGSAAREEVVFRNDKSKSVGDRLLHTWRNYCKKGVVVDFEVEEMCEREGIPVFESLVLTKKRLEKEAAKIMGKKESDWAYADDLLDKVDELGRVLATCSLACVVGYTVEDLGSVIDGAVAAMDEAK
jgi:hypothetical protein